MGPFEMVVAIVAIVMIASIIKTRVRARHGVHEDRHGNPVALADPDAERMREEIKALKERIATLERIATDTNSAVALDREIEKLR